MSLRRLVGWPVVGTSLSMLVPMWVVPALGVEVTSRGQVGMESRTFYPDVDEDTQDANVAVASRLEAHLDASLLEAQVRLFALYDLLDRARSRATVEEAYVELRYEWFRTRVGYQLLNWTATEAFHPADIVSSRVFDSSFERLDKQGEPMVLVQAKVLEGVVEGYFMPFYVQPVFPSPRSRQNIGPAGITLARSVWLERNGEVKTFGEDFFTPQWGARIRQTLGSADVSVHVVQHIDRQTPLMVVGPTSLQSFVASRGATPLTVRPLWQPVTQVGGTYVHDVMGLLIKAEGAYRWYDRPRNGATPDSPYALLSQSDFATGRVSREIPNRDHGLVALGLEYGLTHESGLDSSFLLEGQAQLGLAGAAEADTEVLFQRDVLVGYRLNLNDEAGTSFMILGIWDLEDIDHVMASMGFARRLSDTWTVDAGLRFNHLPPDNPSAPERFEYLHESHQVYLNLTRYF